MSDQELLDYSEEHVFYELEMFQAAGQTLLSRQMNRLVLNAMIESFVIHLRNLIDFFYPDRVQPDDVVAAEFFNGAKEWGRLSNITPKLAACRVRANKELMHLTRKRIAGTSPNKPWKVAELTCEIKHVAKKFTLSASTNKLHIRVKHFVDAWL
jgi:hypothetical protein